MALLRGICDDPHLVSGLYAPIAAHGGQRKDPGGVDLLIALAVYDYAAQGFPAPALAALELVLPGIRRALRGERAGHDAR